MMDVLFKYMNIYTKCRCMNELLQGNEVRARKVLLQMCTHLYSGMKMGVLLSVRIHSVPAKVPLYTAALRAQTCLHSLT